MNPAALIILLFYKIQLHFETLELSSATEKNQPQNTDYGVLHLVFLHTSHLFLPLSFPVAN